jgi:hypothetical protein
LSAALSEPALIASPQSMTADRLIIFIFVCSIVFWFSGFQGEAYGPDD